MAPRRRISGIAAIADAPQLLKNEAYDEIGKENVSVPQETTPPRSRTSERMTTKTPPKRRKSERVAIEDAPQQKKHKIPDENEKKNTAVPEEASEAAESDWHENAAV